MASQPAQNYRSRVFASPAIPVPALGGSGPRIRPQFDLYAAAGDSRRGNPAYERTHRPDMSPLGNRGATCHGCQRRCHWDG